jgi:ferric-dicitrate binding protein FerR (iron transport regulator)
MEYRTTTHLMKTHQTTDSLAEPFEESIAEDAAGWLICFQTQQFSPDDPYRDPAVRNAAFFEWVKCSPVHLLLFMEMMELERRFHRLDARALADIRRLMEEPSMTPCCSVPEPGMRYAAAISGKK